MDPNTMPQDQAAMPPQPAQQTGQLTPPQANADVFGGEEPASPEEDDAYLRVVGRAFQLIYDEKMFPKIIEQLKGGGNPQEGLAKTAAMVVARIATAVNEKKAEVSVSADAAFAAGRVIFDDLAELSNIAKIKDYDADPDALEGAWFSALDQYRIMATEAGDINPESFQSDFAKLQAMDQDGSLEQRIQGLAQRDSAKMKQQSQPQDQQPSQGLMNQQGGM